MVGSHRDEALHSGRTSKDGWRSSGIGLFDRFVFCDTCLCTSGASVNQVWKIRSHLLVRFMSLASFCQREARWWKLDPVFFVNLNVLSFCSTELSDSNVKKVRIQGRVLASTKSVKLWREQPIYGLIHGIFCQNGQTQDKKSIFFSWFRPLEQF